MFDFSTRKEIHIPTYKELVLLEIDPKISTEAVKVSRNVNCGELIPFKVGSTTYYGVCIESTKTGRAAPCIVRGAAICKSKILNWDKFRDAEEVLMRQGIRVIGPERIAL